MMKNIKTGKKYFIGGFLVLILVLGVFVVLRNKEIKIQFDENGRVIVMDKKWYESPIQFAKKLVDLQERLEEMKKLDDFGGATPQETMDAFVEALKKGDTELASRYFVFNKQEQMAKELVVGRENGNLNKLIIFLEKQTFGTEIPRGYYSFEFINENNIVESSTDLSFNENTRVWKIESL